MARSLIKLTRNGEDRYLEWSSICDAPVTRGMTFAELTAYIKDMYGQQGLNDLPARLERIAARGHSSITDLSPTVELYVMFNRAGPKETCLTVDGLWDRYCEPEDPADKDPE